MEMNSKKRMDALVRSIRRVDQHRNEKRLKDLEYRQLHSLDSQLKSANEKT